MSRFVAPDRDVELQGHCAGMVSRFLAYLIDVFTLGLVYAVLDALVRYALEVVTGRTWSNTDSGTLTVVLFVTWSFLYLAIPLAASGKTFGKSILGLKVVRTDGSELGLRHAAVRTLVFPLSFLIAGLGLLLGLVQRHHRCLHDLIAGTIVVYAWDARTARLRFLASDR